MAGQDFTPPRSPAFPQHFEDAIHYEIRRVARIMQSTIEQIFLKRCDWTDQFCDCKEVGTVHDLKSDQQFCSRHFRMVEYRREVKRG